jgi:hypothetical protein
MISYRAGNPGATPDKSQLPQTTDSIPLLVQNESASSRVKLIQCSTQTWVKILNTTKGKTTFDRTTMLPAPTGEAKLCCMKIRS